LSKQSALRCKVFAWLVDRPGVCDSIAVISTPATIIQIILLTAIPCCLGACSAAPVKVRVLSYNIHHGQGTDGRFDLKRLADVITQSRADLIALQEVDRKTTRAKGVDQAAELARLTGMHFAFGKAIDFAGGDYGVAVLSRWPITEAQTHSLPSSPGHETRVALIVRVRVGFTNRHLRLVNTHLDHTSDSTERISQAGRINHLLMDKAGLPSILAGDLNATPDSQPLEILLSRWTDATTMNDRYPQPTWPSSKPHKRIDYVLVRPASSWQVNHAAVLEKPRASDHRPLLVILQLK